mmetsp:Transcript_23976/g.37763  ORF Transcript_23976/g.37763 Transcript_23976/m.37763 type:complete len:91 (+) Transcript_23976:220-492(+)
MLLLPLFSVNYGGCIYNPRYETNAHIIAPNDSHNNDNSNDESVAAILNSNQPLPPRGRTMASRRFLLGRITSGLQRSCSIRKIHRKEYGT